jgi:phage terminase large subunit
MPNIEIQKGAVFNKTHQAFRGGKKIIIHKGGTGSGKTYDLMIFFAFMIALQQKDKIITIVSESRPHLEIGVIRVLKDLMKKVGLFSDDDWNISTSRYNFPTGSIIEFFSADRIHKAVGARRDYLFGNEINSLKFEVWDELARRSEYIFGDFNPTSAFWLEKFFEYYGDHALIKSNYLDNPFLPDTERQRISRRAELDANFRRVHVDCEYGIFEGLIFADWQQIDEFPLNCKVVRYGLDFGYTNDPSVLVKIGTIGDNLYVDELFYQTQLTNQDIRSRLVSAGLNGHEVIADSAEPKSIDEIYQNRFDGLGKINIKPAIKGGDSIKFGIDKIKQYKLHVTKRSVNLIRELRNYAWAKDKNGNQMNKPIDSFNHGIDAIRYAISLKPQGQTKYSFA